MGLALAGIPGELPLELCRVCAEGDAQFQRGFHQRRAVLRVEHRAGGQNRGAARDERGAVLALVVQLAHEVEDFGLGLVGHLCLPSKCAVGGSVVVAQSAARVCDSGVWADQPSRSYARLVSAYCHAAPAARPADVAERRATS
jgi:hypothetical protein